MVLLDYGTTLKEQRYSPARSKEKERAWNGLLVMKLTKVSCVLYKICLKGLGRVLYAGYSNGMMRIISIHKEGFSLLNTMKVHSASLFKIKASPSGQVISLCKN